MIILIGSTRPAKVEGVREAVAAIAQVDPRFSHADLQPHNLTDIAPRMPMSVAEIVDGARRRAQALLTRTPYVEPTVRFAVGLEGGMERLPSVQNEWTLQTWAAVTDGERWGHGAGPSLVLPRLIAERVASGEELGDVMDRLAGDAIRGTRGAWGVLTLDLIGRRDAFRLAAIAAFAPFYNSSHWQDTLVNEERRTKNEERNTERRTANATQNQERRTEPRTKNAT